MKLYAFQKSPIQKMSYVRIPNGFTRSQVGKRIVYQSNPPGLRVKIWNLHDFDELKEKGRFSHIRRTELNFSTKKLNQPDHVEDDHLGIDDETNPPVSKPSSSRFTSNPTQNPQQSTSNPAQNPPQQSTSIPAQKPSQPFLSPSAQKPKQNKVKK